MKTTIWLKSFSGSLAALLGGVILASAQDGGTYILDPYFTNSPAPQVVYVWGLPTLRPTALVPGGYGVTTTDGAGRIDGVTDLLITNLTAFGNSPTGRFITDISGSIRSVGRSALANVKLNVRGGGFIENTNATTQQEASIAFTFNGTLATSNSAVGPFETNVHIVYLNPNGTTNFEDDDSFSGLFTNINVTVGTTNLTFYVNTSANVSTNLGATNTITQTNVAYIDSGELSPTFEYRFGTVSDTNVIDSITLISSVSNNLVTNVFNVVTIGTNISFGTPVPVWGIAYSSLPAFVNAYASGRLYAGTNGVPPTNFVVRVVNTNAFAGSTSTNTFGALSYSNRWAEIKGVIKGSIRSGRASQSLNNEAAIYNQFHYIYSSQVTANGVLVTAQQVNGNNNWFLAVLNSLGLDTRVVQIGKKIFLATDNIYQGIAFSGKATINPKKHTYAGTLRGVGFARGSAATIRGATGPLGLTASTNLVTITNVAAIPAVTVDDDPPVTAFNLMNVTTNVSGTNIYIGTNLWKSVPVPGTNNPANIPDAIQTLDLNGRFLGQKIRGIGFGF